MCESYKGNTAFNRHSDWKPVILFAATIGSGSFGKRHVLLSIPVYLPGTRSYYFKSFLLALAWKARTDHSYEVNRLGTLRTQEHWGHLKRWDKTGCGTQSLSSQADVLASVPSSTFSERGPGSLYSDRLYMLGARNKKVNMSSTWETHVLVGDTDTIEPSNNRKCTC